MFALLTPMLGCAERAPATSATAAQPRPAPRPGSASPVRTQPPAAVLEYLGRYAVAADGIDLLGFAQDDDEVLQPVPQPERH
jgi:hypothetical protein